MSKVLEKIAEIKKCVQAERLSCYDPVETIREISEIPYIDGSFRVIPNLWGDHIRLNGKRDSNAIDLLSEIVSWYRSKIKQSESTGELIGYNKNFKAHMFQCSMLDLSTRVGITKNQTIPAIHRLEKAGLIIRDIRDIKLKSGRVFNNVQFLAPVASAVRAITLKKLGLAPEQESDEELDFTPIASNDVDVSNDPLPNLNWGGGNSEKQKKTLPNLNRVGCLVEIGESTQLKLGTYTKNTTKNQTAAATEENKTLETFKNPADFAAAVSDLEIVKKENGSAGKNQTATSPSGKLTVDESVISDALTNNQTVFVQKKLQSLSNGDDLLRLLLEVQAGLLDKACFAGCGNVFHRKLNAITNAIKNNTWSAPASLSMKALTDKDIEKQAEEDALNELKTQHNNAWMSYNHWIKMASFNSTPDYVSNNAQLQHSAWQNLKKWDELLRKQCPELKLAPLPKEPIQLEFIPGETA